MGSDTKKIVDCTFCWKIGSEGKTFFVKDGFNAKDFIMGIQFESDCPIVMFAIHSEWHPYYKVATMHYVGLIEIY